MCGICGIVHRDPAYAVDARLLEAMRDRMTHRGPDDAGNFVEPGVGLGSRRLAILDLSARGHMPMASPDGRYHLAYNGEIYNFQELRDELIAQGVVFRSGTDTEVLLWLYIREGPRMLHRLNGMFGFAVWDTRERTLFIARDRVGVKPVYYARHAGAFYFASEQKALLGAGVPASFNANRWEELLCFRFIAGEETALAGIRALLPGHYLVLKNDQLTIHRWWRLDERARERRELPDTPERFRAAFDRSVQLRRISDVPVGVFLSGGLDSSAVAATIALQAGSGVHSYNMGFDQPEFDERPLATELARRYELNHHGFTVPDTNLFALLERASWLNDEPLAHGNDLYLHVIAARAKTEVTVLLSGEGADEILGGYVRYRPLRFPRLLRFSSGWFPPLTRTLGLKGRWAKLARFLELGPLDKFVLYNACNVLPGDLRAFGFEPRQEFPYREAVLAEAKAYSPEPVRQAMYLDQHTFLTSLLHRNDRMTMGASIECRVPFLDFNLVEAAAALPTRTMFGEGQGKWLLRQAMAERLPASILRHHKWGFGVPWSGYMREESKFRTIVNDLPQQEPIASGPFDRAALRRIIDGFMQGRNEHYALLQHLMMIVIWHDVTFRQNRAATRRVDPGLVIEQRSGPQAVSAAR